MKPQELPQLTQDLIKARDSIKKYGWIRGKMGNQHGGYCMVGVIHATTTSSRSRRNAVIKILSEVMPQRFKKRCLSGWSPRTIVMTFNDNRTFGAKSRQQVLGVFTKAINKSKIAALEKVL